MAMLKQLSVNCRIREKQHRFVKLFSSASDSNAADGKPSNPPPPPSPLSSSSSSSRLSDVKASLRQPSPPRKFSSPPPLKETPNFATQKPSKIASLEEIQKNLSEFRRRSAAPLRGGEGEKPSAAQPLSFQELYKSNVMDKGKEEEGKLSFEAIKESLRKLSSAGNENRFRGSEKISQIPSPLSLKTLKESLKRQPVDPTVPRSPLSPLPLSIFGKELDEKASPESPALKTEFVKMYSYGELGDKLRKLRPEVRGKKNWFSLEELNQRLMKLREIEEKETESRIGGVNFKELRESLVRLRISSDASNKKSSMQRLGLLGQLGGQVTPSYMLAPPKEHLVEKYFHPDNMSSAEKLKLELKKVRDEFKMSESDCGSSRVQIAQLTTKIKNLSSALHKKDKHSRKGLQGMVQRRKKLLKYLRRTDWESYCFVLNKLGLRDNPNYKN